MNRNVLLGLLLQVMKSVLGNANLQDLINKVVTVILTKNGQPAKIVVADEGVKVVYTDGTEVPHDETLAVTFKVE